MHDLISLGFQAVAAALGRRKPIAEPRSPERPAARVLPFRPGVAVPTAADPEELRSHPLSYVHRNEAQVLAELAALTNRPGGSPLAAAQAMWGRPGRGRRSADA